MNRPSSAMDRLSAMLVVGDGLLVGVHLPPEE